MQQAPKMANEAPAETHHAQDRVTEFHYLADYRGKGPRVITLVGPGWTTTMKRHYGISHAPFHQRAALPCEPSKDEKGHPWGWVATPREALLDEARWASTNALEIFSQLLAQESDQHAGAAA